MYGRRREQEGEGKRVMDEERRGMRDGGNGGGVGKGGEGGGKGETRVVLRWDGRYGPHCVRNERRGTPDQSLIRAFQVG